MADQEGTPIPNHSDDPEIILMWPIDEFMPVAIAFGAGMVVGETLIALIFGLVLHRVYKRTKQSKPDGFFLHQVYWLGFMKPRGYSVPSPFSRFFRI